MRIVAEALAMESSTAPLSSCCTLTPFPPDLGTEAPPPVSREHRLPGSGLSPEFDLQGNLKLLDGPEYGWECDWDAENRLATLTHYEPDPEGTGFLAYILHQIGYTYDAQGRRISKRVSALRLSTGEVLNFEETLFLWDGWTLLAEFVRTQENGPWHLRRGYLWGLDLSGSQEGAGGVGGLLWVVEHTPGRAESHRQLAPWYDGNGNVMGWVENEPGYTLPLWRMEYDPYGKLLVEDPVRVARHQKHRTLGIEEKWLHRPPVGFSTKYEDAETGLVYYGFRYYSPELGRWLSRDPIEEEGCINLYGFVNNDPVNYFDADGRFPGSAGHGDKISPADSAALINSEQNKADATFDSSLANARNPRHASLGRNLYRLNSIRKAIGTDAGNKFVFTCKYGWIDHGHFYNNAWLTYMTGGRALPAIGSWLNEAGQWLVGSDSSWTLEDLESNALGRQLGQDALDHDRPVINSWQNQPLGMGTTFAQTLNQRRPNIPISGGQFYHIAAAWKRLLREGGAVHWPDDGDIRGLVNSILDEDIRHYLSNPINITSIEQARAFRQTSKAWQCLCNGDKPRMNVLIYR